MNDIILLSCPFCGSDNVMPEVTHTSISRVYITCKDCMANGPAYFYTKQGQLPEFTKLAIDGWNIRQGGEGG